MVTKRHSKSTAASSSLGSSKRLAPASHQRSHLSKGKSVLPPSPADLHGHLTFTTKEAKARYKDICQRQIIPCKYAHRPTLEQLGITVEFDELMHNIGWQHFVEINCPGFIELTHEFYATFQFNKSGEFTLSSPEVIQFCLLGRVFKFSITEFNLALGVINDDFATSDAYLGSTCDFSPDFQPVSLWTTLSCGRTTYDPSQSKGSYLHSPILRYVHRLLAFSFSGRKHSSATLTKSEFYFLWAMLNGVKVNLGCWLASQFHTVLHTKKPLILGSFITHLAIHLGLLDLANTNLHVACPMHPLDMACLERMGVVVYVQGTFRFAQAGPTILPKQLHYKLGPVSLEPDNHAEEVVLPVSLPTSSYVDPLQRIEH